MGIEDNIKRYYWIKLKLSFMDSDKIDFLMSQPNGAQYVVLYQMLSLSVANTGGQLITKMGEVIVPYDVSKIQRECKYFSEDTVRVAIDYYRKLGMIYELENGTLCIADFDDFVGGESASAKRMRKLRASHCDKNVTPNVTLNVTQDIRDKTIEKKRVDIRDNLCHSDKSERPKVNPEIQEIFDYWNSCKLIVHEKLTANLSKSIEKAIKTYGAEEVKNCIARYSEIYHDNRYFFSYKWSLSKFLTQSNCIGDFTDEGSKWCDYQAKKENFTYNEIKNRVPDYDSYDDYNNKRLPDGSVVEIPSGLYLYNWDDEWERNNYIRFKDEVGFFAKPDEWFRWKKEHGL